MRDFICPNCGQRLAFENSVCLSCKSKLGFSLDDMAFLVIAEGSESEHGGAVDASEYQLCANLHLAKCNWLVEKGPIVKLIAFGQMQIRTQPVLALVDRACMFAFLRRCDDQKRHVVERKAQPTLAVQAHRVLEGQSLSAVGTQEITHPALPRHEAPRRQRRR